MWFQISYCKLIFKKTCHLCFGINQSIGTTIWKAIKILLLLPTTHLFKAWFCSCVWMLKSLLLCQTLCDPMDYSPPGSSVHGILQARILKWVAMPSSRGSSWPRDWTCISCIGRWILYHWATSVGWHQVSFKRHQSLLCLFHRLPPGDLSMIPSNQGSLVHVTGGWVTNSQLWIEGVGV